MDTTTKNDVAATAFGERSPFEIGIVMAGAVTAGAYTAGVLDFLIEALDEWERARATQASSDDPTQWEIPGHRVTLRVMAGASAGSLAAAIGTWSMLRNAAPTRALPAPGEGNPLFRSWVELARVEELLALRDIATSEGLPSLLDGSAFETTLAIAFERSAGASIDLTGGLRSRPWIDRELELLLTTSSLRGIPYAADYTGGSFYVRTCGDRVHFRLGSGGGPGSIELDVKNPAAKCWDDLASAALASSAFPIALPSRFFATPTAAYADRIKTAAMGDGHPSRNVPPAWPPNFDSYESLYVDGGLFDNAPLELARSALARGGRNERDPARARRALVLVDPFPGAAPGPFVTTTPKTPHLTRDLRDIVRAVLYQPRFQPSDIALASDDRVASRFMIAPRRTDAAGARSLGPLASAPVFAFAGALDESFRIHDFFLGRRNCQQFLRESFALDPANPLFRDPTGNHPGRQAAWTERGYDTAWSGEAGPIRKRVVVPLVGSAREEVKLPSWPRIGAADLERRLRGPLRDRLKHVVRGIASDSSWWPARLLSWNLAAWCVAVPLTNKVMEIVVDELMSARLCDGAAD